MIQSPGLATSICSSDLPATVTAAPTKAGLTEREQQVLRLMAAGLSNAEIAAELVLGLETIKTHVRNVLARLAVRDRVQAVITAYESGFISPR